MELLQSIKSRRSIRKYSKKQLPTHVVAEILEKAKLAPSAGNSQNWKFIIVTDPKKKKDLSNICSKQLWMTTAPVLLIICNDHRKLSDLYGKTGKMFSIQDCAIIASYIQLLATDKGLATCWVGSFDPDEVQKELEIPDEIDPEIILTLGYSDEVKLEEHQRNELEDIVFFDKWGKRTGEVWKQPLSEKLRGILKRHE